jgi:DNA-binding transcriptional LysR family regulator
VFGNDGLFGLASARPSGTNRREETGALRMNITLRQIEVFVSTARLGNLTRAAVSLHMTPSAASAALKDFEGAIGESLFVRTSNGLAVNERGQALLPRAEAVIVAATDLEDIESDTGQASGRITLACSPSINYLIPGRLATFYEANPRIEIDVLVRDAPEAVGAVASGVAQIGLVAMETVPGVVRHEPWLLDELVVVAGGDSPIRAEKRMSISMLSDQTWIVGGPDSDLMHEFSRIGLTPRATRIMGLPDAVKGAVLAGLGLGCLSRTLVAHELESGELIELETDVHIRRQFSILTQLRRSPSPLTGLVLDWLRAMEN